MLLALAFGLAGWFKFATPIPELAASLSWAAEFPEWLVRFIALAELAGAVGIVLPAVTRILPWLTPLAAAGFAAIQILAIGFHATRGETAETLGVNLALLSVSLFVVWGRWHRAPIPPRA